MASWQAKHRDPLFDQSTQVALERRVKELVGAGLIVAGVLVVALLYYATPNVKQPKFKWLSPGAAIALVFMIIAGLGFAFYVANFSSYNATYGIIGSVIILLLGLWIMNNVLLFGAEVDAAVIRVRNLADGAQVEDEFDLPVRDAVQPLARPA